MNSLIIPVYRNESSIEALLSAITTISQQVPGSLEAVFVVDGSPDRCEAMLRSRLPTCRFESRLVVLSRNFGAFAAMREGLRVARGTRLAVMAADLQDPPDLIVRFFRILQAGSADVVIGARRHRADGLLTRLASGAFWTLYRKFVQPDIPRGGVDIFGCTAAVRDRLVALDESRSTLIGLLFWLGFRRTAVPYDRRARHSGTSSWSLRRKLDYVQDSVYAFSDLPIRALGFVGGLGLLTSAALGTGVLVARLTGAIALPGYAATALIILFFASLNCFGLWIIGSYVWRVFENSKGRPNAVLRSSDVIRRSGRRA